MTELPTDSLRARTDGGEVLRTDRLRLRRFTVGDAAFVLALLNSPGWLQHIGDRQIRDEAQARDWITSRLLLHYDRGFGFWAVERLADGTPIGLCGIIHREGLDAPDIGYALLPEFEGQGYAREAATASLAFGHGPLAMPRILAITSPGNHASARLLNDIGLREEGTTQLPSEPDAPPLRLFVSER